MPYREATGRFARALKGYPQQVRISVVALVLRAAALFALWWLLVDTKGSANLWTGAVVVLLAAALAGAVDPLRAVHPRVRLSMLRRIHRPLLLLLTDTARVTWALPRMLIDRRSELGRLRAVRYRATGADPEDVACRALTEWAASVGPNRYALGCDEKAGILLVHELVASGGPLDPLELG